MGYHPYNTSLLSDDDLPFAHVMLPPGSGTGSGQWAESIHFNQGDVVMVSSLMVIMGRFLSSWECLVTPSLDLKTVMYQVRLRFSVDK